MPRPPYGDSKTLSLGTKGSFSQLGHFLTLYPPFYQQFPGIVTKYVVP